MWHVQSKSILRQVFQSTSSRNHFSTYRPTSCCLLGSKSNGGTERKLVPRTPDHPITKNSEKEEPYHSVNKRNNAGFNRRQNNNKQKKKNRRKEGHELSTKWKDIREARSVVNGIFGQISALENVITAAQVSPVGLENDQQATIDKVQMELFQETKQIFRLLVRNVEDGTMNPSGKHGKQISNFLQLILRVYSRLLLPIQEKQELSVYDACIEVLDTLDQWNLDCQNSHYELAITCASHEGRWNEAATLFWKFIDPEAGGKPVDMQVDNPLGLFVIARSSQEQEGVSPVEQVFDAVLRMSMVSPSDQEKYVLAAGAALGHAGEWEAAVRYIQSSSVAQQLGEPLVAGVMHACLLCDRFEEALEIYNDHIGSAHHQIADEWQWGGGSDRADPLCRDLAMQAMARTRGMSDTALEYFRQTKEENVTISFEALRGVVGACECDRRWVDAVSVIHEILDCSSDTNWIVPGSDMLITEREAINELSKVQSKSVAVRWLPEIGGILASAMRTCNASSKFGVSLIIFRLVDLALPSSGPRDLGLDMTIPKFSQSLDTSLEQSLTPMFLRLRETKEVLPATMDALGGLRCFKNAANLFDLVQSYCGSGQISNNSRQLYDRVLDEIMKREDRVIGNSWESADRHIHRLTAVVRTIQDSGEDVLPESRKKIDIALAAAMHASTDAYQPEASLFLAAWTEKALNTPSPENLNDRSVENQFGIEISSDRFSGFRMDALVAEAIYALRFGRRNSEAIALFEALLSRHGGNTSQWRLSCTAGLSTLVAEGRVDDALEIFNNLEDSALTVDAFTAVGKGVFRGKKWSKVYELYRSAHSKGCLSEDLGILAMRSVILSREEGKLRMLRGIVDDMADCAGVESNNFLVSRYWDLKRALGFDYARLLMWWNDPNTCHLHELALALEEFEKQRLSGLRPRHEVIRVIVGNAISFKEGSIPDNRADLVALPRKKSEWIELLLRILEETRDSPLHRDPIFVDDANQALRNLNCTIDCVEYVNDTFLKVKGERVNE